MRIIDLGWKWLLPALLITSMGYEATLMVLHGLSRESAAILLICESILALYILIRRNQVSDFSKVVVGMLWGIGVALLFSLGVLYRPWYAPVNLINACTALGMILMVAQGR